MKAAPPRRLYGVLVTLLGVLTVSPDATLLRSMRDLGASSATAAAAKYCGLFLVFTVLGLYRGAHRAPQSWAHTITAAVLQFINTICSTCAFLLTTTGHAMLLISLTPLWAALLGAFFLREPLVGRTRVAISLSLLAMLVMFAPRLLGQPDEATSVELASRARTIAGDLLATVAGLAQAGFLCCNRHATLHAPKADLTLGQAAASFAAFVAMVSMPCDDAHDDAFFACTAHLWSSPPFLGLAAADAVRPPSRTHGLGRRARSELSRAACARSASSALAASM
jgi:drug/metabolite transporter (DMT)-like permease